MLLSATKSVVICYSSNGKLNRNIANNAAMEIFYFSFGVYVYSFLLGICLEMELPGHEHHTFSFSRCCQFSKVVELF